MNRCKIKPLMLAGMLIFNAQLLLSMESKGSEATSSSRKKQRVGKLVEELTDQQRLDKNLYDAIENNEPVPVVYNLVGQGANILSKHRNNRIDDLPLFLIFEKGRIDLLDGVVYNSSLPEPVPLDSQDLMKLFIAKGKIETIALFLNYIDRKYEKFFVDPYFDGRPSGCPNINFEIKAIDELLFLSADSAKDVNVRFFKELLRLGANINAPDWTKKTLLYNALLSKKNAAYIKFLLDNGASSLNLDDFDAYNNRLRYDETSEHPHTINELYKRTPLLLAMANNNISTDIVKLLCDYTHNEDHLYVSFILAIKKVKSSHRDVLDRFEDRMNDILDYLFIRLGEQHCLTRSSQYGSTLFITLVSSDLHKVLVPRLLNSAFIDINYTDARGDSALLSAMHNYCHVSNYSLNLEMFLLLLKREDLNINVENKAGSSVLKKIIDGGDHRGYCKLLDLLLKQDLEINVQSDTTGRTILHKIAFISDYSLWSEWIKKIPLIYAKSPDIIDLKDDKGETPLMVAIRLDRLKVASTFLDCHASASFLCTVGGRKNTLLHKMLMHEGNDSTLVQEVVKKLLDNGADNRPLNHQGKKAIDLTTDPKVIEMLTNWDYVTWQDCQSYILK